MAVAALVFAVISFTTTSGDATTLATDEAHSVGSAYLARVELEALGFYRMMQSKHLEPSYVTESDLDPTTAELGQMLGAKAPVNLVRDFQNLYGQVVVLYGTVFGGKTRGPLSSNDMSVICRHGHGAYGFAPWALRVGADLRQFLPRDDRQGIPKTAKALSQLCTEMVKHHP